MHKLPEAYFAKQTLGTGNSQAVNAVLGQTGQVQGVICLQESKLPDVSLMCCNACGCQFLQHTWIECCCSFGFLELSSLASFGQLLIVLLLERLAIMLPILVKDWTAPPLNQLSGNAPTSHKVTLQRRLMLPRVANMLMTTNT